MPLPRVTIQIVTWNSLRYLPECLKSIFDQTYRDFQVLVIDNNSQDATVSWLRTNYPQVAVFENNKNVGFSRAHNQGIKLLNSPLVAVCNPDIILEPDWLEKIVSAVDADGDKKYGSFAGKLLRLKVINLELNEIEKTTTIDSCGLKFFKNHRVIELGAGQDANTFTKQQEVFGFSGALVLYRREALADCLIKTASNPHGEYFDEDFFSYKEDIDLAWRLQLFGWSAFLVPEALAYHLRSLSGSENNNFRRIFANRRQQSAFCRYYSYRNHLLLLIKNQTLANLLAYLSFILVFELKKLAYVLFFETKNLRALFDLIKILPKILKKKGFIMKHSKIRGQQIKKWFV